MNEYYESCLFYKNIKFDKCRKCNGRDCSCEHYLPRVNGRQENSSNKGFGIHHSPADIHVPTIIRNNELIIRRTSKIMDWIRRYNDSGVI